LNGRAIPILVIFSSYSLRALAAYRFFGHTEYYPSQAEHNRVRKVPNPQPRGGKYRDREAAFSV